MARSGDARVTDRGGKGGLAGGGLEGRPYGLAQHQAGSRSHPAQSGIGACSIADGCGVLQVNEAIVKAPPTDSVMVAFFLEGADAVKYALSPADLPDGSEVVTPEELHVTLAYLGKVADQKISEHDLMSRMANLASREVFMPADVQGLGRFAAKEGKSLEPVYLSIGSAALHDFRERITSYLGDAMPTADKRIPTACHAGLRATRDRRWHPHANTRNHIFPLYRSRLGRQSVSFQAAR